MEVPLGWVLTFLTLEGGGVSKPSLVMAYVCLTAPPFSSWWGN